MRKTDAYLMYQSLSDRDKVNFIGKDYVEKENKVKSIPYYKQGQVVGLIVIYHSSHNTYYVEIAVDEKYRQHGIGEELIKRAIEYMNDYELYVLLGYAARDNVAANALLRKFDARPKIMYSFNSYVVSRRDKV